MLTNQLLSIGLHPAPIVRSKKLPVQPSRRLLSSIPPLLSSSLAVCLPQPCDTLPVL